MEWLNNLLSLLRSGGEGLATGPEASVPLPDPTLQERAQGMLNAGSPYEQERLDTILQGLGTKQKRPWAEKLASKGMDLSINSAMNAVNPGSSIPAGAAALQRQLPIPQGFGGRPAGSAGLTFNDVFRFGHPPAGEVLPPETEQLRTGAPRRGRYMFQ